MSEVIEFFADGLRKKIRLTRVGDNVRLEIVPMLDAPPPNAPLWFVEAFANENAQNMANPGIATFPVELFSHPQFHEFIAYKKEPLP